MKALTAVVVGCLAAFHSSYSAAQSSTMTDFVAQNASYSLVFRSVEELKQRGDEVTTELGYSFGVSALFSMAGSQLLVSGIADDNQPCGVMWFEPELIGEPPVKQGWKKPVAAGVAISDTKKLADTLLVDHDKFLSGMIVTRDGSTFGHKQRYFRMVGRYLWVVSHKELYEVLQKAKPLSQVIPRSRLAGINSADVLASISAKTRELERAANQDWAERWIQSRDDLDVAEEEAVRELVSIVYEASYAVLTGRIDRGLEFSFNIFFDQDSLPELRPRILKFSPPAEGVTLAGLPDGNLLFGHAARTDASGIQPALTALVRENNGFWWPGWRDMQSNRFISQLEQLKLLGLFSEIWPLTSRYKVGLYLEEDPAEHGMVSMAAILKTDNPDQLVQEIEALAALVDRTALGSADSEDDLRKTEALIRRLIAQLDDADFQQRQSASTRLVIIGEPALPMIAEARLSKTPGVARRATQIEKLILEDLREKRDAALKSSLLATARPVFIFRPDSGERAGAAVDIIEIRLSEKSELRQLLPVFAGREWSRIRLVRFDKHVSVFFGSRLERLDQMIRNIQALERNEEVPIPETPYGTPLLETRGAEFQGSVARIMRLMKGQHSHQLLADDGLAVSDEPELSSAGVTIEPDFLAVEWRVSLPDLKVIKEHGF